MWFLYVLFAYEVSLDFWIYVYFLSLQDPLITEIWTLEFYFDKKWTNFFNLYFF